MASSQALSGLSLDSSHESRCTARLIQPWVANGEGGVVGGVVGDGGRKPQGQAGAGL